MQKTSHDVVLNLVGSLAQDVLGEHSLPTQCTLGHLSDFSATRTPIGAGFERPGGPYPLDYHREKFKF